MDFTVLWRIAVIASRVRGDIERLWPTAKVVEDEGTDYAFRARMSPKAVSKVLAEEVTGINYDNYKHSTETRRMPFYMICWGAMVQMQEALADRVRPQ
jgi:hypothetical protein